MSDREQFAQIAHQEWATVSESLRLLTKNEWMSESLVFFSKSLHCKFICKKTNDSLRKPMSTFPTLGQIEILKKKADVESIEKLSYFILTLTFNKKVPCKQRKKN